MSTSFTAGGSWRARLADGPVRSVMFVCTGNIARSPFAESVLRHLVPEIAVSSMGTHALEGHPVEELMAAELARRAIPATTGVGELVGPKMLEQDLVLVMSRRQRAYLLDEYPAAGRRVGMLGAVPSLLASVPPGEVLMRSQVAAWTRLAAPDEAEVADPYRRGPEAASVAAARIEELVRGLAGVLAPDVSINSTPQPPR